MASIRDVSRTVLLGGVLVCVSATAQQYKIVDLGALSFRNSVASGINSAGDVVGYAQDRNGVHAFIYSRGQQRDLHEALRCASAGTNEPALATYAEGINDSGDVLVQVKCGPHHSRQNRVYRNGEVIPFPFIGGRNDLDLRAINNSGEVVGSYWRIDCGGLLHSGCLRAARYGLRGEFSDPPSLGGYTDAEASAINDAGQAVGYASVMSGRRHAVIWTGDGVHDLGTLGGRDSRATGINASGQVVGSAETAAHDTHAFLYSDGVMRDLGTLGYDSEASAINAAGQIVGTSRLDRAFHWIAPAFHAFLYQNGIMTDLNSLVTGPLAGSVTLLLEARAINDSGLIAATGLDRRTGATRAYLLVPEPVAAP